MKSNLLIGTRKGLLHYHFNHGTWQMQAVHFEAIPVSYAYVDPRNGTWWACLDHGHWGVKLQRSTDNGQNWEEIPAPAYPEGAEIKPGVPAKNSYMWCLT